MSEYGQSIPNKVLQLSNINGVSKSKFAQIFCQGLVQIGMKFVGQLSTYDPLDPLNAEIGTPQTLSSGEYGHFFFDFPTNESSRSRLEVKHLHGATPRNDGPGGYTATEQLGVLHRRACAVGIARRSDSGRGVIHLSTNKMGIGNRMRRSQPTRRAAMGTRTHAYENNDPRWLPDRRNRKVDSGELLHANS